VGRTVEGAQPAVGGGFKLLSISFGRPLSWGGLHTRSALISLFFVRTFRVLGGGGRGGGQTIVDVRWRLPGGVSLGADVPIQDIPSHEIPATEVALELRSSASSVARWPHGWP